MQWVCKSGHVSDAGGEKAAGYSFTEILEKIIGLALENNCLENNCLADN